MVHPFRDFLYLCAMRVDFSMLSILYVIILVNQIKIVMKKSYSFLLLALMFLFSTNGWSLNQIGGVYQIGSEEDLVAFGQLVEQEIYYLQAELTADITYSGQPLGGSKRFRGIFDGKGHTITLNQERSADEAGLFYSTGQPSVIKNLTVDGTITTSAKFAAAFVGNANSLFLNCVSKVNIVSSVAGDGTNGGLVGHLVSDNSYCVFVNCVSAATITSETCKNCAGFLGWAGSDATFINCITVADINLAEENYSGSNTFARNPSKCTFTNCYYINKVDAVSDGITQVTDEQMKNGEVLAMLANATDWVQGPDCPLPVQTGDAALTMEISTPAQLLQFAQRVNAGESTLNGKLTGDIDLTGIDWTPIGSRETPYVGTFDGQHHAITNFNYTSVAANEGLFGFIAGATVKDFSIAGELVDVKGSCGTIGFATTSSYISGILCKLNILSEVTKGHGGGIVGSLRGGDVYNCEYAGTYTIRENGADSKGGIVGYANFGRITACVMSGTINTAVSGNIGGILGYVNHGTFQGVWNCLVTGSVEVPALSDFKSVNAVVGQINTSTSKDVFGGNVWLASVCNFDGAKGTGGANSVDEDATKVYKAADDALSTGEACYYLNACNPANPVWYQTLGKDEKPSLQGEDVVYLVGRKKCDGTEAEGFGFSNTNSGFTQDPHQVGEDGFCTVCGALNQSEDGYYLIGAAKAFRWIATKVNAGELDNVKMRLTADIDLAGENWQPIGDDNHPFYGVLDGAKHKISNMIVEVEGVPGGLFGTVVNFSANDLIIDSSCSVTSTVYTGGLIGHAISAGTQNLVNIGVLCNVTNNGSGGDSSAAGGIIGNSNSGAITHMTGCFTTGAISAAKDVGQLSGWTNVASAKIIDCWSIAQVPDGCKFFRSGSAPVVSNCYSTAEPLPGGVTLLEYTEDMMESGELCYKLNGLQEKIVWYQTLGEDATPLPWNDHKQVYGNGALNCDGSPLAGTLTYSNTQESIIPDHEFEHGFCVNCNLFDATYKTPVGGVYELADGGDVLWFSALVNKGTTDANARLTDDIDMSDYMDRFEPIGKASGKGYSGTFDGQGHKISNFVLDVEGSDKGLIGFAASGMVLQNLIMDETCSIKATDNSVGIVGSSDFNQDGAITFNNVGMEGSVFSAGKNAGGLIGCNHGSKSQYTFNNCYVTGSVIGESGESAALSGWAGSTKTVINNCWVAAEVEGYQEGKDVVRLGGTNTITNCYSVKGEQWTKIEEEEIGNGSLTWKLNGQSFLSPSWYQQIGEDKYPGWDSTRGLVYANGEDSYADVHDDNTYNIFRDYEINALKEEASDAIAYQALLDSYDEILDGMLDIDNLKEFLKAYKGLQVTKDSVDASIKAYAAYDAACQYALKYLEENDFSCAERDFLESYLASEDAPGETFRNGGYKYIMENHLLSNEEIADETAYVNELLTAAIAADYPANTEITDLLTNPTFAADGNGWVVESSTAMNYASNKEVMPAVEGWNNTFSFTQTLTGLKDGIYLLQANAAFRANATITSSLYAGTISLNDNINFAMSEGEDVVSIDEAVDGVNCLLTGDYKDYSYVYGDMEGWVPMGPYGCSYAFNAGRYVNYAAVEVKGGELTVGVANPGTGLDRDWMGFGNFRLFYLGGVDEVNEEYQAKLATALQGYVSRAETIYNFSPSDGLDYAKYPNFSAALQDALAEAIEEASEAEGVAEKMELIGRFSDLFKQIYDCRLAYTEAFGMQDNLAIAVTKMWEKGLVSDDIYNSTLDLCEAVGLAYETGSMSAEEARAYIESMSNIAFYPPVKDGVYQISTPQHLSLFSMLVNDGHFNINGALVNDIDMEGVDFTPIGYNEANPAGNKDDGYLYSGTFDGQGHRIYNLIIDGTLEGTVNAIGVGLFGNITTGARISNLILDKTCSIIGYDRVGLIGRSSKSGGVYLDNLGNEGTVTATYQAGAGIMGNANNGSVAYITNCYSTGAISSGSGKNSAQICGWLGNVGAKITNCWSIAPITGNDSADNLFCRRGGATFVNNYSNNGTNEKTGAYTMPQESFENGEVCFKLNEPQDHLVWFQTIGSDMHPVLDRSHSIVYKNDGGDYFNDPEDGIAELQEDNKTGKNLQGTVYNLNGQRVSRAQKGIYIIDGKKISVK